MNEEDTPLHTDDSDDSNGTRSRMYLTLMDSDTEKPEQTKSKDTDSEEDQVTTKKRSKKLRIDDSDQDGEPTVADNAPNNISDGSETEVLEPTNVSDRKTSRIIAHSDGSDSDEKPMDRDLTKYKCLIDEESSGSLASEQGKPQPPVPRKKKLTKKKQKMKSRKKTKSDGPSEKDILKSLNLSCSSSDSGSDESAESSNSSPSNDEDGHPNQQSIQPREKVKQRMSAKQAIEQMQVIQSESQRMAREAHINVPYHKARSLSLKEFLNRKTNVKHTDVTHGNKTAAAQIKMTAEELKNYAHLLEKRGREAEEFFKTVESPTPPTEEKVEDKSETAESSINVEKIVPSEPQTVEASEPVLDGEKEIALLDSEATVPDTQIVNETELPPETKDNTEVAKATEIDYDIFDDEQQTEIDDVKDTIEAVKCYTPIISGTPDEIIDLETGDVMRRPLTGPELLLDQMLRSRGLKNKPADEEKSVSILSTEHGFLEKINVKFHVDTEEGPTKEQRPGAAYLKLKQTLEEKIARRRKEGLTSKDILPVEPEKEISRKSCSDSDSDYGANEDDNMENELSDDEQDPVDLKVATDDEDSSSSSSEEETEAQGGEDGETKKKGRILKAFVDSDEENIETTEMAPNFTVPGPHACSVDDTEAIQLLWADSETVDDASKKVLDDNVEDDLLDLCSGVFSITQPSESSSAQEPKTDSAIRGLISQPATQSVEDTELLELCSGTFATQATVKDVNPAEEEVLEKTAKVVKGKLLLDSDEEVDRPAGEEESKQKKKKKRKQLQYSDDEELEEEVVSDEDRVDIEPNEEDEQEAEVERFVDYDSEENEVEVKWTEKNKRFHAANFFENEAELSGSENSADEDEQGMDQYDIELGDEEGFDQAKLQSDLERIHMRRMHDQDVREVKILKELFFEDEENDGLGRSRQFRWKHLDENGVEIEGGTNAENTENDGQPGSDEENEEVWRKMRHERELFKIKSQSVNPDATANVDVTNEVATANGLVKKRISIIRKTDTISLDRPTEKVSPFLITKVDRIDVVRGSFLSRDSNVLQKLADLTKNNEYLETANTVTSTNRLVFTGISPATAKLQSSKRMSENNGQTESKRKKLSY